MKYKAKKSASSLTKPLEFANGIHDDWKVTVRAVTVARERELDNRATRNGVLNGEARAALYAEELVVGWEGLTPAMFDAMVELEDGIDRPPIDGNGKIPHSQELATFLINEGRILTPLGVRTFEALVLSTARTAHHVAAIEKKSGSGES